MSHSCTEDLDPEIAELLDFTPVPRQNKRQDGWTPPLQRRFIAKLADTGSPAKAAEALGKNRYGVEKLYKSPGAEEFRKAWDRAVELAEERLAARREAEHAAFASLRPPGADPRRKSLPPPGPEPSDDEGTDERAEKKALLDNLMMNYFRKLDAERRCRLAGNIVGADFYLRQLTWVEVCLDIATSGGALAAFMKLRLKSADGHWDCHPIHVAETDASRYLDLARRIYWQHADEPERPPPSPEETFEEHAMIAPDGRQLTIRTQPSHIRGGPGWREREAKRKEDEQRWAEEQVKWESRAIAEHKARSQGDK
jgi:hypothetical protein